MSKQGRHGEANFAAICQEPDIVASAVVNRANNDQHGWDYVVDIEPPKHVHLPADLQTHLIQCFTQIKTTNCKTPQTKFKLSNAIKAAKSPLPSFVFLFHYQAPSIKPVLYGRHIWENEITHYLKRARKTDNIHLHKQYVTISFSEKDRLEKNPIEWILDVLGQHGGDNYAAKNCHS